MHFSKKKLDSQKYHHHDLNFVFKVMKIIQTKEKNV